MYKSIFTENTKIVLEFVVLVITALVALYVFLSVCMKRKQRIRVVEFFLNAFALLVIPVSLASKSVAILARYGVIENISLMLLGEEIVCYGMMSISYLIVFSLISRDKALSIRLIARFVGSLAFTFEVFLVNNALKAVEASRIQGCPADIFIRILREDLHYTRGLGVFRYVILFLTQLALFAGVNFLYVKMKQGTAHEESSIISAEISTGTSQQ